MIRILHELGPFFEDNYRRIHVREYAQLQKISPPTASKRLERSHTDGLLKKEIDRQYFYYCADRSSASFRDLQRMYWRLRMKPLLTHVKEHCVDPVIVLFGSLAKAEASEDSDIDLAFFTPSSVPDVTAFEGELGRTIQVFAFRNLEEVSEELRKGILNGYIVSGSW